MNVNASVGLPNPDLDARFLVEYMPNDNDFSFARIRSCGQVKSARRLVVSNLANPYNSRGHGLFQHMRTPEFTCLPVIPDLK